MKLNSKSSNSGKWLCWAALACLVVPMFASYFFDDMFSTLSQIFQHPESLELGWSSADYGFYAGGYSFLCVCGGLVVCGILLDVFVLVFVLGIAIFQINRTFSSIDTDKLNQLGDVHLMKRM